MKRDKKSDFKEAKIEFESKSEVEVVPLKDWHIKFNEHDIKLVEGEKCSIPSMFVENLKTEQVIK